MAKYDVAAIRWAIQQAQSVASGLRDEPDDGSCNLDNAYLSVPGMRRSTAELCGIRITSSRWFGRIGFVGNYSGQASRRTLEAQAICDSLKAQGYDAGVWYHTD